MKELIKKLAKAKSNIGGISKDSTNPFFKSKYFDINSLISHVEPILHANELVLLQPIKDNKVYSMIYDVTTGESVSSFMELPIIQDPQKIGSAISYYRRYTLQSLLSLQAVDDDGNKASKPSQKKTLTDKDVEAVIKWAKSNTKTIIDIEKHYTFSKELREIILFKLK